MSDFPGLNVVAVVTESLRTMKSNKAYPTVVPRCVPYILT